jgi:hypothetical protein
VWRGAEEDASRGSQSTFLSAAASLKEGAIKARSNLRELPLEQKTLILLLAGGVAGATAKTCVAPLERLKLLAQAGELKGGIVDGMQRVIREEGMQGLWRGNTVNMLRMIPNKGVLHATNDLYKDLARNVALAVPAFAACGLGAQQFVSGSLAGMTSVAATYPLDLVRTRMAGRLATQSTVSKGIVQSTWIATVKDVVKHEGVRGLYRGVSPTLLGSIPYEGIKFYSYAKFKEWLPHNPDGSQVTSPPSLPPPSQQALGSTRKHGQSNVPRGSTGC